MKSRLFLFWNIGKNVYLKQNIYENVYEKNSVFCSYFYGITSCFTRENIRYMKKFYCVFPMYYDVLNKLSWEHYKILLNINNKDNLYFYYRISLFCNSSLEELIYLVSNNFYEIIKER